MNNERLALQFIKRQDFRFPVFYDCTKTPVWGPKLLWGHDPTVTAIISECI